MTAGERIDGVARTADERRSRMLHTALGPIIGAALDEPEIVEVLLNPDGTLWFDHLARGRELSSFTMSATDAERIIRLVAAHVQAEVHAAAPILSAELPETGERFEGLLPPIVRAPAFAIRKRACALIGLDAYVRDRISAIIVVSNLAFDRWPSALADDATLTATLLDRLLHHANIVQIRGDS